MRVGNGLENQTHRLPHWLPILAIVVAAGCSDSTSDDGSAQPERDASVEGAADASVDVSSDAAFDSQQNDSQPGDSQAADAESGAEDAADGATVTCERIDGPGWPDPVACALSSFRPSPAQSRRRARSV